MLQFPVAKVVLFFDLHNTSLFKIPQIFAVEVFDVGGGFVDFGLGVGGVYFG